MRDKIKVNLNGTTSKVHESCIEFGIEEYCAREEEIIMVAADDKEPKHLDIEYVKDYVEGVEL